MSGEEEAEQGGSYADVGHPSVAHLTAGVEAEEVEAEQRTVGVAGDDLDSIDD